MSFTIPYSSPIVMVLKEEINWFMCHNLHVLNKLTIKDKYIIPIIEDLLDEIHCENLFTK